MTLRDLRSLRDQEGRAFTFAGLGKTTILVNFIFTSCPMKCPAQTQALVGLHRALAPDLRSRVRFVSVTVDPERDSAAALKRYALALGADVPGWIFVTGTQNELDRLYRYFSVGVSAIADGQYDHQMGAYLLDAQGRVMQRYTGDIDKPRLLREIQAVDALGR
jgi:protein SCO1/2